MSGRMTEAEFMQRAKVGATNPGSPTVESKFMLPALIDFLRSHGFHDVARAVVTLHEYRGW